MTILHSTYRPKRPPKRKTPVAIPMRIVSAKAPKPTAPAVAAVPESRPAPPAAITGPRIVTASRKTSTRFGPVQDIDAEEHQRRGDAAVELFREIVRRATGNGGTEHPERYWRSYGDDPLPTGAEAMHEPFAAFPSWLMRITCDRCGQDRFLVETHFDRREMLLRDIIKRMRHDGCGGRAGKVELLTGIEGVTSRPVRKIVLME
jgi:hypothetical protein